MRAFGLVCASLVVLLAFATDAFACSCLQPDLVRDLPRADGAFVGTMLERKVERQNAVYLFLVEQVCSRRKVTSRPKLLRIIPARNQTTNAFHHERPVFAIRYAEPGVGGAEDFAPFLARANEIIHDQRNIYFRFFFLTVAL